eukprot:COSAG06_NODE_1475_length_9337_cov_6.585733_7_plen_153_part_00
MSALCISLNGSTVPDNVMLTLVLDTSTQWVDVTTPGAAMRSVYLALRHAQLPVDILIEEDCTAGLLQYYNVLYISMPQITTAATEGIATWVKTGGTVVAAPGAGHLNEFNQSNPAMEELLGIKPAGIFRGGGDFYNSTVQWVVSVITILALW